MSCADGPMGAQDTKSASSKSSSLQPGSFAGPQACLPQAQSGHPCGSNLVLPALEWANPAQAASKKRKADPSKTLEAKDPTMSDEHGEEPSIEEQQRKTAVNVLRAAAMEEFPGHAWTDVHIMIVLSGSGHEPVVLLE
jgi:hypothetical protein